MALAVAVTTDTASSVSNRSIQASSGSVSFASSSIATTETTASATAAGGQHSDNKGGSDVTGQAQDQIDYGNTEAADSGSQGAPSGTKPPKAQDSSGNSVSLAGGIAVNIASNESSAALPGGLVIAAGGPLTLVVRRHHRRVGLGGRFGDGYGECRRWGCGGAERREVDEHGDDRRR